MGYKRRGRRRIECSLEIELDAAMELYCGLMGAGLELTEVSHRVLTEVCVLRAHHRMLSGPPRLLRVRLVTSFIRIDEEAELFEAIAARR